MVYIQKDLKKRNTYLFLVHYFRHRALKTPRVP